MVEYRDETYVSGPHPWLTTVVILYEANLLYQSLLTSQAYLALILAYIAQMNVLYTELNFRPKTLSPSASLMPGHAGTPDELQELLPGLLLGPEAPKHGRGDCRRSRLLYTAHRHAHVSTVSDTRCEHSRSLHDHGHSPRPNSLHDSHRDLLSQALLHLQATGECLRNPSKLAQPQH